MPPFSCLRIEVPREAGEQAVPDGQGLVTRLFPRARLAD